MAGPFGSQFEGAAVVRLRCGAVEADERDSAMSDGASIRLAATRALSLTEIAAGSRPGSVLLQQIDLRNAVGRDWVMPRCRAHSMSPSECRSPRVVSVRLAVPGLSWPWRQL